MGISIKLHHLSYLVSCTLFAKSLELDAQRSQTIMSSNYDTIPQHNNFLSEHLFTL